MRRYSVTEGTLAEITAELDAAGADRANGPHPKPEKAAEFAEALSALNHGALEVRVRHAIYRVTDAWPAGQHLTDQGDCDALLSTLGHYQSSYVGVSDELAAEYRRAIEAVRRGALAVVAGGTLYRVVEG